MEEIILATNNKGKLEEIKQILKDKKIISLKDAGIEIDVVEDKDTFEGNAIKKASEISKMTGKTCIADDSGICIDVLDGFPGVFTARFLGENVSQEERNTYLIEKLKGKEKQERRAEVITCIALVIPNGETKVFKGVLEGYISKERRGTNGFGFDEIFELEDGRTLAELNSEYKNEISSRKSALNQLEDYLKWLNC